MVKPLLLVLTLAGGPGLAADARIAGARSGERAASAQETPDEGAREEGAGDDHLDEPEPPPRPRTRVESGPVLTDAGRIRVREAKVRIVIDVDPWRRVPPSGYGGGIQRFTTWTLENPGPERVVVIGYSFRWEEPRTGPTPTGHELVQWEDVAEVGEDGASRWVPDCTRLDGTEWVERAGDAARGWCRWTIKVPPGRSEARFVAAAPFGEHWIGDLDAFRYDFAAERALREPPARVVVTIAAGKGWDRPIVPISPAGGTRKDGHVSWTFARQDLSTLRVLATWASPLATPWEGTPGAVGGGFSARASSTLSPQGRVRYDAAQVLDSDLSTVWCEGAPGEGKGEWLEARTNLPPDAAQRCELQGFVVVGGHSRSQESWQRNGRLRRHRIEPCGAPERGMEVAPIVADTAPRTVPRSAPWDRGAQVGWFVAAKGPRTPSQTSDGCWRLTILDVVPGKDPDTCVSELIPLIRCKR